MIEDMVWRLIEEKVVCSYSYTSYQDYTYQGVLALASYSYSQGSEVKLAVRTVYTQLKQTELLLNDPKPKRRIQLASYQYSLS